MSTGRLMIEMTTSSSMRVNPAVARRVQPVHVWLLMGDSFAKVYSFGRKLLSVAAFGNVAGRSDQNDVDTDGKSECDRKSRASRYAIVRQHPPASSHWPRQESTFDSRPRRTTGLTRPILEPGDCPRTCDNTPMLTLLDIPFAVTPQRTLHLDIRVPPGVTKPALVVYIPVSGMRQCNKEGAPTWLIEHGFAMASIQVRVSPEVIAPLPVYDCKSAIRWLRAHASEYGYDPENIGVWGHSAGGLLASLMATSSDMPQLEGDGPHQGISSRVQAACDECGSPHTLSYFARPEIKARSPGVHHNLSLYLGGPVEERSELATLVSPATYVSTKCPPIFQIHGEADNMVPIEDSIAFHQALLAAGVDSTIRTLPGIGHGWEAALTRDDVVAFFRRALMKE
jgi:acetyl esterase/lipase